MNEYEEQKAARIRELSLPVQFRMAGNLRYLRDAVLSSMMLGGYESEWNENWAVMAERARQRGNQKVRMDARVSALKANMQPEDIQRATNAARGLYEFEAVKARREAARKLNRRK